MDQRFAAADAAINAGRAADAVELIIASLTENPEAPFQAYRVLVNQLYKLARYEDGALWAAKALEREPKNFDMLNLHGVLLRRNGRHQDALKVLAEAQRLNPKDVTPLVNRGNIYNDLSNGPGAEAIFSKLVRQFPRNPEYQRALGRALANQGKYGPAALRFRQAVTLKKDFVEAWLDLAGLESGRHNHAEAFAILERALTGMADDHPRLLEAKAVLLRRAGRLRDADRFLTSLLPRFENEPWLHYQIAGSVSDFDRPRANVHYRKAVELAPDKNEYRFALAESLERTREGDEGANIEEAYQTLKGLKHPDLSNSSSVKIALDILIRVGDYEGSDAIGSFEEIGRLYANNGRHTALLKHLARVQTLDDRAELMQQHRIWGDLAIAEAKRNPITRASKPRVGGKIRVGFMSSDLRHHPVAYFAQPLFEHFDRNRFEVYCYSFYQGEKADDLQQRIASQVDVFRWDQNLSDREAAQKIADDQLDMLIELGGSTHMNKLSVMAYKPARLSASWLGYPHSAGLTTIDYLVMDPYMMPDDPALLLEKPLMLPHAWYALGARSFREQPAVNPTAPVERNGYITYGTANQTYKYNPTMLRAWAQIVARTPNSRFLFVRPEGGSATFRRNMQSAFAAEGVSADRLVFQAVRGAHLPFYNEMDISLDAFPQTGGTTTCEALWMGVPVVTLVGPAVFERLSYSVLMNADLSDLCARSVEDYIEIAVTLSRDPKRIGELRRSMRDRMKASPLGRTEQFATDFYDAVDRAVQESA